MSIEILFQQLKTFLKLKKSTIQSQFDKGIRYFVEKYKMLFVTEFFH